MFTITNNLRKLLLDKLIEDFGDSNNSFYAFYSNPYPWDNDLLPPDVVNSDKDVSFTPNTYCIMGKKIDSSDIRYMAKKILWEANVVFDSYKTDMDKSKANYYVITADNNCYKCLDNNKGSQSTAKPILVQNSIFTTSDGYTWKYMFTVEEQDLAKFGSSNYFPIIDNPLIKGSATTGIDIVNVVNGGSGYLTYHTDHIASVLNNKTVQIPSSAIKQDDFYNQCTFYVLSGPGAGKISKIRNYIANTSGNWVVLYDVMTGLSALSTQYVISPTVEITGDGTGAKAISFVNTEIGSISSILVVNNGINYTHANVTITGNPNFGFGAIAEVNPPPADGHGAHPELELNSDRILISTEISATEGNTIPQKFTFRTVGCIKNPRYANNDIFTGNTFDQTYTITTNSVNISNSFVIGETSFAEGFIYSGNSANTKLVGDRTFANGEVIYLQSNPDVKARIMSIIKTPDLASIGTVLSINNMTPVTKNNTSESVKITINF